MTAPSETQRYYSSADSDFKSGLPQSDRVGNRRTAATHGNVPVGNTYSSAAPGLNDEDDDPSRLHGIGQQMKGSIEHGWGKMTGNEGLAERGEQTRLAGKAEKHAARASTHANNAAYSASNAVREEAKSDIKWARAEGNPELMGDARIRKTQAQNELDALNQNRV